MPRMLTASVHGCLHGPLARGRSRGVPRERGFERTFGRLVPPSRLRRASAVLSTVKNGGSIQFAIVRRYVRTCLNVEEL